MQTGQAHLSETLDGHRRQARCAEANSFDRDFAVDFHGRVRNHGRMENEPTNFSVKVSRKKDPPCPYVWEIYRGAERKWIKRSMHGYATREQASKAGQRALNRIFEQRAARVMK
jgi:hypothetical protein